MASQINVHVGSDCHVALETFDTYRTLWQSRSGALPWDCLFALPPWIESWWGSFGAHGEPHICSVRRGERVIGIAPMMVQGGKVRFLGDPRLSDHFDCIVAQGREGLFFEALLAHLAATGLGEACFGPSSPHSSVMKFFRENEPSEKVNWFFTADETYSDLELPPSWEEFLAHLDGKQRHEVRRKFRRLHEAGTVQFRKITEVEKTRQAMGTFLDLFTGNRAQKAAFMTGPMAHFFQSLAVSLAQEDLLRLCFLDVNGQPVASVFCVDHRGTRYLYNNGYDGRWQQLSVGTMSKLLSIKDAIEERCERYNFLKGAESYKTKLGGRPTPLSSVHVTLS